MSKYLILSILTVLMISSGWKKHPLNSYQLRENLQQILDKHSAHYKAQFPGKTVGFGLCLKGVDKDKNNVYVIWRNIITTPADLATWCNALYGSNTKLNATLHAEMIKGIPTNEEHVSYGLGTERNPPDLGYGHNGARPAYMTTMRYHPGTKTSYVIFCNFLDTDDFGQQAETLNNIVREAIKAVEASN